MSRLLVALSVLALTATVAEAQEGDGAATLDDVRRELDAQRALIGEQQAQIEAQREQLEALEAAPAEEEFDVEGFLAVTEEEIGEADVLRIYGFLDVGWQRFFASEDNFFAGVHPTTANSFVLGNFNLFFDVQASEDWRALAEVRFTTLPHGVEVAYGVPALDIPYERADTETFDITSSTGRVNVILGSIIMERAWIEYEFRDWLRVRAGSFFTPVGIWNIDHATPTLIALNLPNMIADELFPLRQLGLQVHGVVHADPLEVGYHVTISNGRTPGQFDLTDDKAIGGRLFLRNHDGASGFALGVSGYYGTFSDEVKNITSFDPFRIAPLATVKGADGAIGVDFSLDYSGLRWRAEGVAARIDYDSGFSEPAFGAPDTFAPNRWETSAYTILAYRFSGIPIEPYIFFEASHRPSSFGDTSFGYSVGVNVYFMEEVQFKLQAIRYLFRNVDLPPDPAVDSGDFGFITTRLVMAF